MSKSGKVYTSINLPSTLSEKLDLCVEKLGVDKTELLSVLCYKAGKFVCSEVHCLQTVDYQERGKDYEIVPVYFFSSDHEYMHANRLACKVSVSKLLVCAMVLFLDEIMEKGINQMEIAHLQIIQHSYKKKSYNIRNFSFKITKTHVFEKYMMKMNIKKT